LTSVALVASVGFLAAVVLAVALVRARRRARALQRRRVVALEGLAQTIERLAGEVAACADKAGPPSTPVRVATVGSTSVDPATGLPARAALVDALIERVAQARTTGSRLGLAVVAVDALDVRIDAAVSRVANAARETAPDTPAFRAGERAVALVLADAGRADAIAAGARIEALLGSNPAVSVSVVELEQGEDAIGLLARALRAPVRL
jgi:GGDEF domain-containing protein